MAVVIISIISSVNVITLSSDVGSYISYITKFITRTKFLLISFSFLIREEAACRYFSESIVLQTFFSILLKFKYLDCYLES